MWSKVAAVVRVAMVSALPMGFLLGALSGTVVADPTMDRTCTAQWCQNGRDNAYMQAQYQAMIDGQLEQLGCDRAKRLAPRVAVRPASGETGVVRVVTFDEAWSLAESGDAWVVGYCG